MRITQMSAAEVLEKVEAAVEAAGSAKALAERWDVSQPYLSDVRAGKRAPGPSILVHLGLAAEQVYIPAEKAS